MRISRIVSTVLLSLLGVTRGLRAPAPRVSRSAVVSGACSAIALPWLPRRATAADKKYSKKFEECLSKCVYDKTKIAKGIGKVEVMDRPEAFKLCKVQCATKNEAALVGKFKEQASGE